MSMMNDHIMSLNDSIPKDKERHLPLFNIREGSRRMEDAYFRMKIRLC